MSTRRRGDLLKRLDNKRLENKKLSHFFNNNKNKGFLSSLMGRKKNSSKYGYYGLNLFYKEILDKGGRIVPKNIALVITNIGLIFSNEAFQHERYAYLQLLMTNINKSMNLFIQSTLMGSQSNYYKKSFTPILHLQFSGTLRNQLLCDWMTNID